MWEDRPRGRIANGFLALGLCLLGIGLWVLWQELPPVYPAGQAEAELVAAGCKQKQTLIYESCGHEVLRRVDVPPQWVGMTKEGVLSQMAEGFRMTAFGPMEIGMQRRIPMFCPQHTVLSLSEEGVPGIYRNRYGFAMDRLGDVNLTITDEALRDRLVRGMAFDSREALEEWVRLEKQPGQAGGGE